MTNGLTYLTNVSVSASSGYLGGETILEFSGIAECTPEMYAAMRKWLGEGKRLPNFSIEWMCLYCGTPQSYSRVNCSQCGAPRSHLGW